MYAGYGKQFFSAQSGRMSFASRSAARILCAGGTVNDVYARMGATWLWAPRSNAIERYCDIRTRRFFEGNNPLSWEQFTQLSPETMHEMASPLPAPRRREAAWFCQDQRMLLRLARNLGKTFPEDTAQSKIRSFIASALFRRDPSLREWLRRRNPGKTVNWSYAAKPITLLLEWNLIPDSGAFFLDQLTEEQMCELEAGMTVVPPPSGRSVLEQPVLRGRRVREIRITSITQRRFIAFFLHRHARKTSCYIKFTCFVVLCIHSV